MGVWHNWEEFKDSVDRKLKLKRFINDYNAVKPHKDILGKTPYEALDDYFKQEV